MVVGWGPSAGRQLTSGGGVRKAAAVEQLALQAKARGRLGSGWLSCGRCGGWEWLRLGLEPLDPLPLDRQTGGSQSPFLSQPHLQNSDNTAPTQQPSHFCFRRRIGAEWATRGQPPTLNQHTLLPSVYTGHLVNAEDYVQDSYR